MVCSIRLFDRFFLCFVPFIYTNSLFQSSLLFVFSSVLFLLFLLIISFKYLFLFQLIAAGVYSRDERCMMNIEQSLHHQRQCYSYNVRCSCTPVPYPCCDFFLQICQIFISISYAIITFKVECSHDCHICLLVFE